MRENRESLVADISGLTQVTGTLLKQKQALSEILDLAPTALQNLDGSYDPEAKALRTKNNFQMAANPTALRLPDPEVPAPSTDVVQRFDDRSDPRPDPRPA